MARIKNTNSDSRLVAPLSGKVALVTGGSRGIGRAIALRLASLGAAVSICGRDRAGLKDSTAMLAKLGPPVFSQVADVTRVPAIAELVAKTEAALGPVTILVNNAGIGLFGPAHEFTETDWDRILDTNLKSAFPRLTRRGSLHDPPWFRRHHQYQLARR